MALLGKQTPRLASIPDGNVALGDQAVEFARWCGLTLYPWQEDLLRDMCRTGEDGNWAAREAVVVVPRQNGKGEVLVALELAGIYLFGEKMIGHSAHFMDTAIDAQGRLWEVIEGNDNLMYWWEDDLVHPGVPQLGRTNGKENITFPTGQKALFRTRTDKTFRGLPLDRVIFDECFNLPNEINAAMSKTTRARERAQRVYISSPVDRQVHMHGAIFSAKRWAGIDGAEGVLFKEWSPDDGVDIFAEETMRATNPSLVDSGPGAQLSDIKGDAEAAKHSEILRRQYMVESLGWGDWYPRDGDLVDDWQPVLTAEEVAGMTVTGVHRADVSGWMLCVDASPDRDVCSVAVAGRRGDGTVVGMVGYHGPLNVPEVAGAVLAVCDEIDPAEILVDPKSSAWVVAEALERHGLEVTRLNYSNVKAATGAFLQGQRDASMLMVDDEATVATAFDVAELKADANGGVRWARRDGQGTICQLTAVSYAMWAAQNQDGAVVPPVQVKKLRRSSGTPGVVRRKSAAMEMNF